MAIKPSSQLNGKSLRSWSQCKFKELKRSNRGAWDGAEATSSKWGSTVLKSSTPPPPKNEAQAAPPQHHRKLVKWGENLFSSASSSFSSASKSQQLLEVRAILIIERISPQYHNIYNIIIHTISYLPDPSSLTYFLRNCFKLSPHFNPEFGRI